MVNCRLLSRVAYACRPVTDGNDISGYTIRVSDTFPYNPESKTSPETAKKWASRHYGPKKGDPTYLEQDNLPFEVTLTSLEIRSEGGRAYKVVDVAGRRFDLREDQLVEVIQHCGILPAGKIPGNFIWGILGSSLRLVYVGGKLHKSMVDGQKAHEESKFKRVNNMLPSESNLIVGHVYKKRDGTKHLYIGKATRGNKTYYACVEMPVKPCVSESSHAKINIVYDRYGDRYTYHRAEAHATLDVSLKWSNMSWAERCEWEWYAQHRFTHLEYKDQVPDGYYDLPGKIVMMTSPKFESDTGETADELAVTLRVNAENKHRYFSGNGNNLALPKDISALATSLNNELSLLSAQERIQRQKNEYATQMNARREANEKFKKELVWL